MSDNVDSRKILTAVQKMSGTFKNDPVHLLFGQVVSVDLDNTEIGAPSCTVSIKNDVPVPNVALQGAFADGILLVPSVGSQVVFLKSVNGPFAVIVATSDLDALYMQVNGSWLVNWGPNGEDAQNFTPTSYGGLIKLVDPSNPDAGVLARLNKIEQDINNLKTIFTEWEPVPNDGGSSLKSACSDWYGQPLIQTLRDDLENNKITHGD